MNADELKVRFKSVQGQHAEPSRVRLHRAISWLKRAEAETDDDDARFIFLWIAFNAAYAREYAFEQTERVRLRQFLATLVEADQGKTLHAVVFKDFPGPIRTLIENRYVFEPFWKALREHDSSERWKEQYESQNKAAFQLLMQERTDAVLAIVFDRLYVLRNQLVHGGATWNGGINRQQVRDGARILSALVPIVVTLMSIHSNLVSDEIAYPVCDSNK